jgi:phosphatidylethanolamine/phosphatidyl-N-methylethanolamine N-methyltransferase
MRLYPAATTPTGGRDVPMLDDRNLKIYRGWAPVYDATMGPLYARGRARAVKSLQLRAGESVIAPGIGTGADIDSIPAEVRLTGIDLSPEMLAVAKRKATDRPGVTLEEGNAQALPYPDGSFDAALCNLILSVVPDGAAAFSEAWRVLKPGGRLAIFDKFLAEDGYVSGARRIIGKVAEAVGTDVNRKFSDIVGDRADLQVVSDQPAMLGGIYRVILLRKDERTERGET